VRAEKKPENRAAQVEPWVIITRNQALTVQAKGPSTLISILFVLFHIVERLKMLTCDNISQLDTEIKKIKELADTRL
jgi:hypothetical protein